MKNILCIVLLALLTLTGCNLPSDSIFAPKPFRMGPPPPGNETFRLGWKHGCNTGLSTMGPNYYKSFYRFEQDPMMTSNAEYYKAWKDAYTYCRQYMFKWVDFAWDKK